MPPQPSPNVVIGPVPDEDLGPYGLQGMPYSVQGIRLNTSNFNEEHGKIRNYLVILANHSYLAPLTRGLIYQELNPKSDMNYGKKEALYTIIKVNDTKKELFIFGKWRIYFSPFLTEIIQYLNF